MPELENLPEECAELARSGNLFREMAKELAAHGHAGAPDVPLLVYLVFLTGMFDRPVSLVLKGPSSVGKSHSLKSGQQFIPPEAYEQFEGMSEKALVYLKDLDLKNKHLVIGEAAGMSEGSGRTLVRQLLSEGKVRYATVLSTREGLEGAELPSLEGPCGLIMTTTASALHPEDESRMISVNLKESPQQIVETLLAQATGQGGSVPGPDLKPWHAYYRYLRRCPKSVSIPYARSLAEAMPSTHDRIKRDFPHMLSLISASALMHICSRNRDAEGKTVATLADYGNVYRLLNQPISEGLSKTVPEQVRAAVNAVESEMAANQRVRHGEGISISRLAELIKKDQGSTSRLVNKATDDGFLTNSNPGQGRPARLIVGDRKLPSELVMPSPAELKNVSSQVGVAR